MRYSVVIYDAVGIEEATIVCETKADAQEMAVRCAKMYAGEGYMIEIEKEPDRWEGILGTREMRRKARREGRTRKPATLYAVDEEEAVPVAEVVIPQPKEDESVSRRERGGRRRGSRRPSTEVTTTEPATQEAPEEVLVEAVELVEEVTAPETPASEEEVRTSSRRRRGGRRRRPRRSTEETPETQESAEAGSQHEQQIEVEPAATPAELPAESVHPEEPRQETRRRWGVRRRRSSSAEQASGETVETPLEPAAEAAPVAPAQSEDRADVAASEPAPARSRRPRRRKSTDTPAEGEAASATQSQEEVERPEERSPEGESGGNNGSEPVGVSWRRPRRRRPHRPQAEPTPTDQS